MKADEEKDVKSLANHVVHHVVSLAVGVNHLQFGSSPIALDDPFLEHYACILPLERR